MKRVMVAVAGAMAVAGSAFAGATSWFDGGIAEGWPKSGSMYGGAWTNTEYSVYEKNAVTIGNDTEAPLKFVADEPKTLGEDLQNVAVSSTITFTPFSATSLPEVPEGAKSAVISVTNEQTGALTFYVLAKDGEVNAWTNSSIAATEAATAVKILMTSEKTATYTFNDTQSITVDVAVAGTITAANYSGDGVVSNLSATYEEASSGGVTPENPQPIQATTLEEAQEKAAQMTPKLSDDATAAAGDQAEAVTAMLKVTAKEVSPGYFATEVTFKDEATNTVAAAATVIETAIATQNADLAAATVTVTLDDSANIVPGLYYGIVAVDDLGALATTQPVEWALATTAGVTLSAAKPSEAKGFYRVVCSPAPKGQVGE